MTYYCTECVVEWHPYMAQNGVCPSCGGGTRRHNRGTAPSDIDELFEATARERERLDKIDRFEQYYQDEDLAVARQLAYEKAEIEALYVELGEWSKWMT